MSDKKRKPNESKPVGNPADPHGMPVLLDRFLEWMQVRGYSETTIVSRRRYLGYFIAWAEERGIVRPNEVTKPMIERYQRYLYHYRKKNGQPKSFRSQHTQLLPVRAWFKWLTRNNFLLYNPASEMELPKLEQRLPKFVLTASQAEAILMVPDIGTPLGIRDRCLLEIFYSTGIRRMEMANLEVYNVNFERGTLMVRQGKGKKDRLVPIGGRALKWLEKYLYEVRPTLLLDPNEQAMFITTQGEAITSSHVAHIVSKAIEASDQGISGSCHLFRHTMATLMLENGADIRFVQAMLGHAHLDTTQIYTQVAINKLKEIHEATHPAKEKRDDETDAPDHGASSDEASTGTDDTENATDDAPPSKPK